ncbi:DUF1801 domain-containing protein [Carboxylicivirga sp. N1Y90]|uniref:DUF1801 domain-containing protein n=1 Tax=Carboxylicivirga fragile TaxID=3417571 RepID=UPI003D343040|nr:DUF1801 domain-containing protein [Marinilabiliaceae bacterium N1Y90]
MKVIDPTVFYQKQNEPNKSCFLALRSIILNQDENVSETVKYGMPCFCYFNKAFCYLWTDKKSGEPYILFVEGEYLNHAELEKGSRARMKILKVNPNIDLPLNTITQLLNSALDLYKNGTIKIK